MYVFWWYWFSAALMDECAVSPAPLSECVYACRRAGCVVLQIEFGSGPEGWRSEFSAALMLRCVICLCWANQLPSARGQGLVKVRGRQQQWVSYEARCCVCYVCCVTDTKAQTQTRTKLWGSYLAGASPRNSRTSPPDVYSCLNFCLFCLISISNWHPPAPAHSNLYPHYTLISPSHLRLSQRSSPSSIILFFNSSTLLLRLLEKKTKLMRKKAAY